MSITGKGSLSIKKKDVLDQKSMALGFKSLMFAHKASLGDTTIPLGSLVTPTEMSALGFTNPSVTDLQKSSIRTYRRNLRLMSSLRGELIDHLSYVVSSNSSITLIGFTAEEGEIFTGIISESPRSSLNVVDARPIVATGELLDGTTDFNVGTSFPINENSSQQIGAVKVYRNGMLQTRNTGNSDSVLDGNYYEVDSGNGYGLIIRFNEAPDGVDDPIYVTSVSSLVEKPNIGQLAEIESLAGQLDAMIPTLAALAGVPETNYQGAPNNQDLKAFGDKVLSNETQVNRLSNPTSMPDALATKLGHKTYDENDVSITGNNSWSTTSAQMIPYQMQDGRWRLKFNIEGSSSSTGSLDITVDGIDLSGIPFSYQAVVAVGLFTVAGTTNAGFRTFTNGLELRGSTDTSWQISGDILIDIKPTWAV